MSMVNLLPEDYVARRAQKRANVFCTVLFAVVMGGVVAAAVVSERQYRNTRLVSERVNQAYAEAADLIKQLRQLENTRQKLLAKAKLTAGLLERVPRSYLLATVTEALPEGASLTRFELKTRRQVTVRRAPAAKTRYQVAAAKRAAKAKGKVKATGGMSVGITVVGLAGTDVQVAKFIAAMARCPLMETVDLVYSQQKKQGSALVREFRVDVQLKPDADVLAGVSDGQGVLGMARAEVGQKGRAQAQ